MASEDTIKLYNELMQIGCCKRCALRYLGVCKTFINFEDFETTLITFGCISPIEVLRNESKHKRKKENPCIACLGLLQDSLFDEMLAHEDLVKVKEYDSQTFQVHITFPICSLIRDHSVKIYLKKTFPTCFDSSTVIKLNHAWRYTIENRLSKTIGKKFSPVAPLIIHFSTSYLLDNEEMEILHSSFDQRRQETLSRHFVANVLESISDEHFENIVRVPSGIPFYEVTLTELKHYTENVYLMGRYCKYSRNLLLVPLSIDGEVVENRSMESIVINAVKSVVSDFDQITFHASSFDGPHVRVLGRGKSFNLVIEKPKFDSLSKEQCREIQNLINTSEEFKVKNLRQANRRDVQVVMESEVVAQRSLKLLCLVYECKNISSCVNSINLYKAVTVEQETPIKHLFKRPLQKRARKIYYMRGTQVSENLIELDLCAESGLHVIEFITGDFGRSKPSLREIINAKVDVLALDIVDLSPTAPHLEEVDILI